ncbi:MAG: alpha/beta fold hydrolase [Bacteroidetes bacterium]|nr:MAG: alpha/beta fold hydrolase [Bacteroidota bacterium]
MALPHPENPTHHPLYLRLTGWAINASGYLWRRLGGQLAYAALAAPQRRTPRPEEADFLAQAERDWLEVGKMKIRTYHWSGGQRLRILLAHGWDSHSGRWQAQAGPLLAAGCELFALDAPAHGESQSRSFNIVYYSEAIAAVAHQVQPDIIIGHSAGGMAAVYHLYRQYRQQQESRIKKLILLATPAHLNDFLASFRDALQLNSRVMQALEQQFYQRFQHGFDYYDLAQFAQHLQLAGLLVHDEDDEVAPVAGAYRFAENWAASTLFLTRGLGHSVQAPQVWKRVTEFCLEPMV